MFRNPNAKGALLTNFPGIPTSVKKKEEDEDKPLPMFGGAAANPN